MAAPFEFSDVQANHILDLTLGRLTRLARHELEDEMTQLRETIAELESILADDAKLRGVIKTELAEIREAHATPRVARITHDPGEMNVEDLLDDKDLLVIMTRAGYIKTVEADAFRTQGRGGRGVAGGKLKEEDLVKRILHTSAHAYLLFFSNRGRVYRLRAHEIPERDRTAKGIPIVNLLPLTPDEHIEAVIDTRDYETNRYLFFATKLGQVKKTLMSEYDKSRREGFIAINLRENDELVQVIQTNGTEDVMIVSRKGMAIRFANDDEQVRPMGRDAAGVRGMRLKAADEVVACDVAHDDAVMLIVTDAGFGKRTRISEFNQQGRGGQGVRAIKLASTRGTVQAAYMVSNPDDEVMLISSSGVTIRLVIGTIGHAPLGRDAMGVKVVSLDDGQTVASVALVLQPPESD
jgi:DNA gyrase subunit A